jgi:hypothetical protein
LDLKPGKWYKMRLEVVGDQAQTTRRNNLGRSTCRHKC